MAANTSPIFELVPTVKGVQFTISDTTAKKTVQTGAAEGTRIDSIMVSTNDTTGVNLLFYINDGSTDFFIGYVNIPAGSGYPSVARVDAMSSLSPILGYLMLPSAYILKAACVATMTTAKVTDVVALGGNF